VEGGPGDDGADVHEAAEVEEDVEAAVDLVVAALGLGEELAVPVQADSGDGAGEEVICAEAAAGAEDEEADGDGEEDV
jgi:hypothetical protein